MASIEVSRIDYARYSDRQLAAIPLIVLLLALAVLVFVLVSLGVLGFVVVPVGRFVVVGSVFVGHTLPFSAGPKRVFNGGGTILLAMAPAGQPNAPRLDWRSAGSASLSRTCPTRSRISTA